MVKFELILESNPVVSEIVKILLSKGSPIKKELITMVVEGPEEHNARKALKHFLADQNQIKVE